jgi:PAS domain S-box-containing protein
MSDRRTTAQQLAAEVAQLRRRLADLEASASERHAEGVLLRAALTASVTAIAITDRTGVIEWVNPAFCTLTQYTVAEAVGKNPRELVKSGQHDPAFYKHLWDTILSGQVWRGNMINRRKDGSFYAEEQTITPVRDAQGAIRHFIAVKEDVTTRRRAEEQLREGARRSVQAEREFRGLFLANPLPMWIYDLATLRFLEVNDAAVGRYGYGREEFLTLTIKDIRPSEDQDLLVTHISQPRDPWQSAGNWRHRFKSGQVIDVEVTSHTITFAGRPAALVVAQDITERKRAVETLQAAEERTRFALQSANVGIWDMDYTTGALQWSDVIESHYGLQPGTFGGTFGAYIERVHPGDRRSVLETIGNAMKSGLDFSVPHRSMAPDGTVRWLRGAGRIVFGEHGEPVRAVGISQDVTERRKLEGQFQQAQKMEAVGRLAGGVAHDFNNLLTVILGYCDLLLPDFHADDPHQADLRQIQKAGTRAAGLTRQLLAFSRKQIIEPTVFDLNAVVSGMRPMLGRLIREDVTVIVAPGPERALLKADRGQVEQIVMNLAVNARDAMPHGGTLTIATANVVLDEDYAASHDGVTPGAYVALSVTDTGIGITPEVQARLWEPYFTTKDVGEGTGLGLATVHGIARQTGGSVGVYSELGKGTSFHVYFPRAEAAAMAVDPKPPVTRQGQAGETVLVVEDAESVRKLARRLLERHGYTVLLASNAAGARRLFAAHPSIELLLTDVVMPGASGPELARELVRQRPALKVVYMSGHTESAIVHHGVLKPGILFLHKPFTSDTVAQKLREALDG